MNRIIINFICISKHLSISCKLFPESTVFKFSIRSFSRLQSTHLSRFNPITALIPHMICCHHWSTTYRYLSMAYYAAEFISIFKFYSPPVYNLSSFPVNKFLYKFFHVCNSAISFYYMCVCCTYCVFM